MEMTPSSLPLISQTNGPAWSTALYRTQASEPKAKIHTLLLEYGILLDERLQAGLEKMGHNIYRQSELAMPTSHPFRQRLHLVLISMTNTNGVGFQICAQLREQSRIPIVLLLDSRHAASVIYGYELGADVVLSMP